MGSKFSKRAAEALPPTIDQRGPRMAPPITPGMDMEQVFFTYRKLQNGCCDTDNQPLVLHCRQGNDEELTKQMHSYSFVSIDDKDFALVQGLVNRYTGQHMEADSKEIEQERALGCMLGNIVGDAIGAPLEFHKLRYGVITVTDMGKGRQGKFKLKPGQWTDDGSMAICLADSLLARGGFDALDSMLRYLAWWQFGYNNSFVFDRDEIWEGHSVGLGGSIADALHYFKYSAGVPFTEAGDKQTSGIGSIMRLAAVSIFYHDNLEEGLRFARKSSLVTHQGEEAAELCCLLFFCCTHAFSQPTGGGKAFLGELVSLGFSSNTSSVMHLANSEAEVLKVTGTPDPNRDWDWKNPDFRYSPERGAKQGGSYVGAYSMDAMAMALHCVWHTDSFHDAMIKAINLCGDADSLGTVVGQLAGAIYGLGAIPPDWISSVQAWDQGGLIALRAYKLFHKKCLGP